MFIDKVYVVSFQPLNLTTSFRKRPYFTTIKMVRHLTSGLGAVTYVIDITFAMAEGSMHTQDSDGTDDLRHSSTFYNIISDYKKSDIMQHSQFWDLRNQK